MGVRPAGKQSPEKIQKKPNRNQQKCFGKIFIQKFETDLEDIKIKTFSGSFYDFHVKVYGVYHYSPIGYNSKYVKYLNPQMIKINDALSNL